MFLSPDSRSHQKQKLFFDRSGGRRVKRGRKKEEKITINQRRTGIGLFLFFLLQTLSMVT